MSKITDGRVADLRLMLQDRQRELVQEVRVRVHDARREGRNDGLDELDTADADIRDDLEFALIQMKAETLSRVDAALVRLDAGAYGNCTECQGEITKNRLRAMPFAVRCTECEDRRERSVEQDRRQAQKRGTPSLFSSATSY
jgi:RNA polymerase-binding transcription factor